ncbi:hypothetical protein LEP1GSC021_2322 [Leptospira noguchii str. 1993005606]|uniref:Uncharacterized protein n=3 Tax=Leptospira noguchii TaxID=28182 RepID=T0GY65_9LEPT|nr:hypothetical protein LEP1GSC186_1632 [Leptospira noguchii serovar Autumnalis str. ZUN142]EMO55109.1 hypothetical protein LEP1GSC172_0868 [Leptospira noguchii]EPE85217.1 hypothetical protein LEP1GSC021_2322 [Leptospira noguchii str. 1993005606]EQA72251.1 hypothetical protein LEP1GSC059_4455 [Leptospira noguchii serovar Panama str. CZ214]
MSLKEFSAEFSYASIAFYQNLSETAFCDKHLGTQFYRDE